MALDKDTLYAHRAMMLHVAQIITRDASVVEDLVQTAFVKAISHWDEFTSEEHLRKWLTVTLRNLAIDLCKARSLELKKIHLVENSGFYSNRSFQNHPLTDTVANAIQKLSCKYRRAFLAEMGVGTQRNKKDYFDARRILRRTLHNAGIEYGFLPGGV